MKETDKKKYKKIAFKCCCGSGCVILILILFKIIFSSKKSIGGSVSNNNKIAPQFEHHVSTILPFQEPNRKFE